MSKEEKQIKRLQNRVKKLLTRAQVLKDIARDAMRETETLQKENKNLHEFIRRINSEL